MAFSCVCGCLLIAFHSAIDLVSCCRFRVHYVLNTAPDGWTGGVGFITADTINQRLQPPADDVLIVRCGPPAMNKAMAAHLDVLGYTKAMQFEF